MQSRLYKTSEKKTKKQLFLSLAGIVIVLFVLFKFGIPVLTNISLYLSSKNGSSQQETTKSTTVIAAPILIEPFTATNSASIIVNGTASKKQTIQLFVNDSQVDTVLAKDDGTFSFPQVPLTQQQNTIKVRAEVQGKTSDFSDAWNVAYLQKAPSLSIDNPHDGDTVGATIVVKGKTDPDVRVTVNDLWAIVDSAGNYSYTLSVQTGDTKITVVATDVAGNTTKQEITVHHS